MGHGKAAKLPDYMLDFESWRTHRAQTASTHDPKKIEPTSTQSQPLDDLSR